LLPDASEQVERAAPLSNSEMRGVGQVISVFHKLKAAAAAKVMKTMETMETMEKKEKTTI